MFENFRERLHLVQQDFTTGFKALGDKSRDTKIKRRSRFEESLSHFSAGLEILSRYEDSWFLLHKTTTDCAQAAEAVDGDIVMICAHWERRRTALTQLEEQLQSLPAFISELDAITANIARRSISSLTAKKGQSLSSWTCRCVELCQLSTPQQWRSSHLEGDFEEMESRLVYLETLCCQCEQAALKQHHMNELEVYKKKKGREVEAMKAELDSQHAQKVAELEQAMQQKQRERQKVYEEAFKQDMKQYLSTGHLQHREPTGVDPCVLDQITVTNLSDQEALDDFLNSSDDISTGSSLTSGPDLESCSSESLKSQMNQTPPTHGRLSVQDAAWEQAASEESDEPLVQSDDEDVQADMSLAGLQDFGTMKDCDESDPAGDLPSA